MWIEVLQGERDSLAHGIITLDRFKQDIIIEGGNGREVNIEPVKQYKRNISLDLNYAGTISGSLQATIILVWGTKPK